MAMDFESRNVVYKPNDIDLTTIKPPKSTIYRQIPMAYSLILSSPYDEWQAELPTHLKEVECKILNDSVDSLEDFYLYFLKSLRNKLFHINEFIEKKVKPNDPGVPDLKNVNIHDRIAFATATNCFTCGTIFHNGGKKRGCSHSRHHNHLDRIPGLGKSFHARQQQQATTATTMTSNDDNNSQFSNSFLSTNF